MGIVQCGNGHYYDDEKYAACPHCSAYPVQDEVTSAFIEEGSEDLTVGFADAGAYEADDRTVGYIESRIQMDPVVGWLVCTEGEESGRDYRLHSGRNFVGRSEGMDITVYDDGEVSREGHCSVVYDPLHAEYLLAPGSGATYLRGSALVEASPLNDGDEIKIGSSKFVFVAFCKGGRGWV
jgi:hypothetical protein